MIRLRTVFKAVLGVCAGVLLLAILLPMLAQPSPHRRISDQNYLKQLGLVFRMYAGEDPDGLFPPLTPYEGIWMFDVKAIYPEYLSDLTILVSPDLPDCEENKRQIQEAGWANPIDWERITRLAAESYAYTGWIAHTEAEARLLHADPLIWSSNRHAASLSTEGLTLWRPSERRIEEWGAGANGEAVRKELEKTSTVLFNSPKLIELRGPDIGANVLYLDGHVSRVNLNEKFPITDDVLKGFK